MNPVVADEADVKLPGSLADLMAAYDLEKSGSGSGSVPNLFGDRPKLLVCRMVPVKTFRLRLSGADDVFGTLEQPWDASYDKARLVLGDTKMAVTRAALVARTHDMLFRPGRRSRHAEWVDVAAAAELREAFKGLRMTFRSDGQRSVCGRDGGGAQRLALQARIAQQSESDGAMRGIDVVRRRRWKFVYLQRQRHLRANRRGAQVVCQAPGAQFSRFESECQSVQARDGGSNN